MRKHKGFTLVEILIVVVILGILAAIVIPQFSQASTEAKLNSSLSSLQSLRSQISLYMIQHNDNPPAVANFEDAMTLCSDATETAFEARSATNRTTYPFGPYVQSVPANPWNGQNGVAAAAGKGNGWVYDEVTGAIYLDISDLDTTKDADVITKLTEANAVAP